jgi:predicted RNase H-like nuclease (RuvC/YqgF family)
MKKFLMIILVAILAGCHDYKADVANLTKEKETLQSDAAYKDSMINGFVYSMNEIETNLGAITQKQEAIKASSSGPELSMSQKERISDEIKAINALMQTNRDKIAQLQKSLKKSNAKAEQFEKAIALLNQQIESKNNELIVLNKKLADLDTQVATLNTNVTTLTAQNEEKTSVINDQTKKMHTAYYTKGTYKELETKHVMDKEGGFLGIGKEKKVVSDFNTDAFATVDITQTKVIPIESKDAKIVTTHPTSSYTLETKEKDKSYVTNLVINDPDQFWKASKYLVVMVQK